MMYLKKTQILAGLLLSINGFLHASSDSAPTSHDPVPVPKALDQMTAACTRALKEAGLTYLKDSKPLLNSALAIGLDSNSLENGGTITNRLERLEGNQAHFTMQISNIINALANMLYESRTNMNMLIEQINNLTERIAILQASQDAHDVMTRSILDPNLIQEDPLTVVKEERTNFLPNPMPATPLPYTDEQLRKKESSNAISDSLLPPIQDSSVSNAPSTESKKDESNS